MGFRLDRLSNGSVSQKVMDGVSKVFFSEPMSKFVWPSWFVQ